MVPVRRTNPFTGRSEVADVRMNVEVDEKLLEQIAGRTGGKAYRATDADTLERVFAEIDGLERTPLQVKRYVRYREGFQPLAWSALALSVLPILFSFLGVTIEP
jgi:Ca-activated chloride channel family protein